MMLMQDRNRPFKHRTAMLTCPSGIAADAEQRAYIPQPRSGQQCVNQRVRGNIAIGIPLNAGAFPLQARQP